MSIPKRPLEGPCHINRTAPALHGFGPSGRSSNILLHYFNEQFTNCQEILTAGQKKYIIRAQSYPAKCRSGHGRAKARIRESRRPVSGRAASGFARIAMPTTAERGGEPPPVQGRYPQTSGAVLRRNAGGTVGHRTHPDWDGSFLFAPRRSPPAAQHRAAKYPGQRFVSKEETGNDQGQLKGWSGQGV